MMIDDDDTNDGDSGGSGDIASFSSAFPAEIPGRATPADCQPLAIAVGLSANFILTLTLLLYERTLDS